MPLSRRVRRWNLAPPVQSFSVQPDRGEREAHIGEVEHVDARQPEAGEVHGDALGAGQQALERAQPIATPGADRRRFFARVDGRCRQRILLLPRLEDDRGNLARHELPAQRAWRAARFLATQEAADVEEVHGRELELREPHRHGALHLQEALDPAVGQRHLLLAMLVGAADLHGKAGRADIEASGPVAPHALELTGQALTEVDVGGAALELVNGREQVVANTHARVGALVARERLEEQLVGMNGNDRIEDVVQLVLVVEDVVEVVPARLVERLHACLAQFVERGSLQLERLQLPSHRLVLGRQALHEQSVLLGHPCRERLAIARAILEVALNDGEERAHRLAKRQRVAERAAEERELARRVGRKCEAGALQPLDDGALTRVLELDVHAPRTFTADSSPGKRTWMRVRASRAGSRSSCVRDATISPSRRAATSAWLMSVSPRTPR